MADAKVCPDCGLTKWVPKGCWSDPKLFGDDDDEIQCVLRALARERTAHEETRRALRETADLAEEGWGYASDYFQRKWDCAERIAKARAALGPQKPAAPLVWEDSVFGRRAEKRGVLFVVVPSVLPFAGFNMAAYGHDCATRAAAEALAEHLAAGLLPEAAPQDKAEAPRG